jgi:hypothetical protein
LAGGGSSGVSTEAGVIELRVGSWLGGVQVFSPAIRITVQPISVEDRKVVRAFVTEAWAPGRTRNLLQYLEATQPTDLFDARYKLFEKQLGEGHLKRTIQRLVATNAACQARTPAERNKAYGELKVLYEQMDPIAAEVTDLTLARACVSGSTHPEYDYARAEFHINRVKDRSRIRDWVQMIVHDAGTPERK